ncbi:MAG: YbhB/YbcL family Raf kinase inhibitor-like protein, partial [Planctomycetaceae bacterium]|nr:YbhB/YbcL family Raf kinase inhibitor-like protein [Planctomycetaceae bacterium]
MSLELNSPAFDSGTMIPSEYTCDGKNISPPLTLSGIPQQADSLVLICDDPDAPPGPNGPFTHWVLYGLPPDLKVIPQGFSPKGRKSQKGMAGRNS